MKELNEFLKRYFKALKAVRKSQKQNKTSGTKIINKSPLQVEELDLPNNIEHLSYFDLLTSLLISLAWEQPPSENFEQIAIYWGTFYEEIETRLGCSIEISVESALRKNQISLDNKLQLLVKARIKNILFFWFILDNKRRPVSIQDLLSNVKESQIYDFISDLRSILSLDDDEIQALKAFVLTTGNNRQVAFHTVGMNAIKERLCSYVAIRDELTEKISELTGWTGNQTKQEISNLLEILNGFVPKMYHPIGSEINSIIDCLSDKTNSKQQIQSFIHTIIQPFFGSLYSFEEFKRLSKVSSNEVGFYRRHQKDSIEQLAKSR